MLGSIVGAWILWGRGEAIADGIGNLVLSIVRLMALAWGAAGLLSSIMIYVDTRRPAWAAPRTAILFAGSLVGLGGVGAACVQAWVTTTPSEVGVLRIGFAVPLLLGTLTLGLKLAWEARFLYGRAPSLVDALGRTVLLIRGPLRHRVSLRVGLAFMGAGCAIAALLSFSTQESRTALMFSVATLLFFAAGEGVERHLFFTAEASHRMPGN